MSFFTERKIPRRTLFIALIKTTATLACTENENIQNVVMNLDIQNMAAGVTDKGLQESGINQIFVYSPGDSRSVVMYLEEATGSRPTAKRVDRTTAKLTDGFVPFDKSFNPAKAQQELDRQYQLKRPPVLPIEESAHFAIVISQISKSPVIVTAYEPPLNTDLMYVSGFPESYKFRGQVPKQTIVRTKFRFTSAKNNTTANPHPISQQLL